MCLAIKHVEEERAGAKQEQEKSGEMSKKQQKEQKMKKCRRGRKIGLHKPEEEDKD